jgi:tellurite methyltransferase
VQPTRNREPSASKGREADPWLQHTAPLFARSLPAPAVDLACGSGHNAIWLARHGHYVTGIDVSPVAVIAAEEAAAAAHVNARFMIWDIEADGLPPGPWGAILVFHYLYRPVMPSLANELAESGLLVYKTHLRHSLRGVDVRPRNPSYLLEPGELVAQFPGLVPLEYREWSLAGSAYAALVARRPQRHSL